MLSLRTRKQSNTALSGLALRRTVGVSCRGFLGNWPLFLLANRIDGEEPLSGADKGRENAYTLNKTAATLYRGFPRAKTIGKTRESGFYTTMAAYGPMSVGRQVMATT